MCSHSSFLVVMNTLAEMEEGPVAMEGIPVSSFCGVTGPGAVASQFDVANSLCVSSLPCL